MANVVKNFETLHAELLNADTTNLRNFTTSMRPSASCTN